MSQADNKKPYELKKVGKHWLIGTIGKRFQRLPVLASATEIVVSENFLIVDEDTIYEIEENEEGKILLQKVEDASINDGERTTGDVFESTDSVDSVDGQKINADSKTTETALQDVHLSEEETAQTKQIFAVKETTADKTNVKQRNSLETTAETITKDDNTTNKEFEIGNTDGSENYDSLDAGNTEETSLIFVEHFTESSEEGRHCGKMEAKTDAELFTRKQKVPQRPDFVDRRGDEETIPDNPRSSGGTEANHPRQRQRQAEHWTPSDEIPATLSKPLSFFDEDFSAYVYLLCGQEEQRLLLSRGDIFKTKATAIVVPYDQRGEHRQLARAIVSKIPSFKTLEYTLALSRGSRGKTLSDVFLTDGFDCGYQYILHAVYPTSTSGKRSQERKPIVQKLYDSIFSYCAKDSKMSSVVTTLLGTDMTRDDVNMCAEIFLQSYIQNCIQQQYPTRLRVHLVCTAESYEIVKDVLDNYVMRKRANFEQSIYIPNMNYTAGENSGEDEGLETCVLCMDTVIEPKTLDCGHTFCTGCIEQQFTFKEACPTCGGNQPEGTMHTDFRNYLHCCGYEGCGQIIITYSIPGGYQGPNHPNPGKWYKGITRVAYLPNNEEGRKVQSMLKIAFDRKLVFTIGSSRTTGEEGVITWNDIHHKTDPRPNKQFGYPDAGYLERVKEELAAKGVTEKDIPKTKR